MNREPNNPQSALDRILRAAYQTGPEYNAALAAQNHRPPANTAGADCVTPSEGPQKAAGVIRRNRFG